jgi:hypothetical protein
MKSLTEHLWLEIPKRRDYVNITPQVEELVRRACLRALPAAASARGSAS